MLRIHAERTKETRYEKEGDEQEGRTRSEFRYGSFTREVELPPGASEDDVKASYRNGIIEVRVPVKELRRRRPARSRSPRNDRLRR